MHHHGGSILTRDTVMVQYDLAKIYLVYLFTDDPGKRRRFPVGEDDGL
jgi:hypothetical protein